MIDEPRQQDAGAAEIPIQTPGTWKRDRQDREYISAVGRRGIIYRQGDETVEQALANDALPKDKRPKRKSTPKLKPPPKQTDLRELEQMLAEAFKAPAYPAAAFGDEWAANHFTEAGPYLARNLVLAAEHNPWLRAKLENAASGGDMMVQLLAMAGLMGAFAQYLVPPLVWWLNLPIPERGRVMLGIPDRAESSPAPPYAAAQTAQAA